MIQEKKNAGWDSFVDQVEAEGLVLDWQGIYDKLFELQAYLQNYNPDPEDKADCLRVKAAADYLARVAFALCGSLISNQRVSTYYLTKNISQAIASLDQTRSPQ
ncbi:MAG: hypothetical protein PHU78_08455 [Heliobacteriaceae bacterium]|nr:hypothetical protein [Heliobacteriaceae bacterium]